MRKNDSRNNSLTRGNALVESPIKKRALHIPPRWPGQERKVGTVTATSRIPTRCKLGNVNKITLAATRANPKRPLVRSERIQVPVHMSSMPWFPPNGTARLIRRLKKDQINNVSDEDNENISPSTSERKTFPFIVVRAAERKDLNKPQLGSANKQTNLEYRMLPHIFLETNTSRSPTKTRKGSVQDQKQKVVPDEERDKKKRVSQDEGIQKAASTGVTNESKTEVKSENPEQKKENKIVIDMQCPIVSSQICPSIKLDQCDDDCINRKTMGEQSRKSSDATDPYYLRYYLIIVYHFSKKEYIDLYLASIRQILHNRVGIVWQAHLHIVYPIQLGNH